jgi:hypothetical protein
VFVVACQHGRSGGKRFAEPRQAQVLVAALGGSEVGKLKDDRVDDAVDTPVFGGVARFVIVGLRDLLPDEILDSGERDIAARVEHRAQQIRHASVQELDVVLAPPSPEAPNRPC